MKPTSLIRIPSLLKTVLAGLVAFGAAASTSGCLDRPIGREQPRTTNVLVDELVQSAVDKIDLLFVVDNSISMADKQAILAQALPDLVDRLVSPICVNADGVEVSHPASATEECQNGSAREFNPIDDIHIGVITSSLGGYGALYDCQQNDDGGSEQRVDMAHLLGSLPRGSAAAPAASATGFLSWEPGSQRNDFVQAFSNLVQESGEFGCGWEATLEAWYRFLVDPYPYTKVVRQPCNSSDTNNLCAGPQLKPGTNEREIDTVIINQRAQFLRPDSLLAIIMLSDENDCSFKASGQAWRLAQTQDEDKQTTAYRATSACDANPNDTCCHSCGLQNVPEGCPTTTTADDDARVVGAGCEQPLYSLAGPPYEDHPNLRCFQQQRRFGVDYLYPVERYNRALTSNKICPFADDLDPASNRCPDGDGVQNNPLYLDLTFDPNVEGAVQALPRSQDLIFLAGIVGVPWQDVAISPNVADPLKYRVNRQDVPEEERVDWSLILGSEDPPGGIPDPLDPLMIESIEPRTGTNPVTGEALVGIEGGFMANSINGHEWNIEAHDDLQYACIFPLPNEVECEDQAVVEAQLDAGEAVPNCDCSEFGGDLYKSPLCQAPNGSYDQTQRYAKAYPSLRQLQVLRDYGKNSIVASICPKETDDTGAADYGYRPAVGAIIDRLKEQLADKCLNRELAVRDNAEGGREAACIIIEAKRLAAGDAPNCMSQAREPIDQEIRTIVLSQLEESEQCSGPADCASFQLCEITQLTADKDPQGYQSCLSSEVASGNGWCYVDPAKDLGEEILVEKCPVTAQRKLRFIGTGTPDAGTVTFVACAGASF